MYKLISKHLLAMHRLVCALCAFAFIACIILSCSAPAAAQESDERQGYFVVAGEFGGDPSRDILSGDGRVLFGSTGEGELGIWTKQGGINIASANGYYLSPTATNYTGSIVVGQFWSPLKYGLFRWSARTGVQLLKPYLSPMDTVLAPMSVNDSGTAISFFCVPSPSSPDWCGVSRLKGQKSSIQMAWSQERGFAQFGSDIKKDAGYVRAFNGKNIYLVEKTNPLGFGILRSSGKFVSFKGFDRPLGAQPDILNTGDHIFTDYDISRVAIQWNETPYGYSIWNDTGMLLKMREIAKNCDELRITAISREAVYGMTYCPLLNQPTGVGVGVRINNGSVQGVSSWLENALKIKHLNPNTIVLAVSSDGKTVFCYTNYGGIGEAGGGSTRSVPNQADVPNAIPYYFVAHIP